MRQATELSLRRGCHRDRRNAGFLGRDDIHDDRGGQRGKSARDVEPHSAYGDDALTHTSTGSHLDRCRRGFHLGLPAHLTTSTNGLGEGLTQGVVKVGSRLDQDLSRNPQMIRNHMVELLAVFAQCLCATVLDRSADRDDGRHRGIDIKVSARHGATQVASGLTGQIDDSQHTVSLVKPRSPVRSVQFAESDARPSPRMQ